MTFSNIFLLEKITNLTLAIAGDIMPANGVDCEGAAGGGNRCGHNVTDNGFILDLPKDKGTAIELRKDSPQVHPYKRNLPKE